MRFLSALLLSLLAALVTSTTLPPGLPSCAKTCVTGFGGCGPLQVKCICSNKPFLAELACCVSKKCDAAEQQQTINFAKAFCQANGNVSNLPTTATCASGAASSATATGTTSTSTTSATTSSAQAANSNAASLVQMPECGLGLLMAGLAAAVL